MEQEEEADSRVEETLRISTLRTLTRLICPRAADREAADSPAAETAIRRGSYDQAETYL